MNQEEEENKKVKVKEDVMKEKQRKENLPDPSYEVMKTEA